MSSSRNSYKVLGLIFLIVLFSRLYFAYQTPYLENDGYLVERYVENILETGRPLTFDQLSYNGREVLYSPLYYYILGIFSFLLGTGIALKLIPSIFISLLVFVVYRLSKKIVNNDNLALLIALMSGFIPVVFVETLINASIYVIVVPIMFYLVDLLMDIDENKKVGTFVFFSFVLSFLHPSALLFSTGLIFYFILASSESVVLSGLKKELMAFNIFSTAFVQFLIYKKAFLEYGTGVVWNNIPLQILSSYFDFSLLGLISWVGTVIVVFGLIGITSGIIKKKDKLYLLSSLVISCLLLLWLRLIEPKIGLIFLSIALVVASTPTLNNLLTYLSKTKLPKHRISFGLIIMALFVLSLAVPSFFYASQHIKNNMPSDYDVLVLNWIKENALPDVTVLSPLGKGHLITGIAGKRTVLDGNFLFAPDTTERYGDVEAVYSTKSEVTALEVIHKYNVDYVFIPIETELKYGKVKWLDDDYCFKGIFFGTPKVYQVLC